MSNSPLEAPPPAPREFLTTDYVHPENARLVAEQHRRYALLTRRERWRMRRKVARLRRELRRYNALNAELAQLVKDVQALKVLYDQEPDKARKAKLAASGKKKNERGRAVRQELARLAPIYSDYQHFNGWLEYERANRKDLEERERIDREIRKGMRRESKDLKAMIISEWKRTLGCHYMAVNSKGEKRALAPKIFRTQTGSDAHYFWVKTRKKTIFGYRSALPHQVDIVNLTDEKSIIRNIEGTVNRTVTPVWSAQGQLIYRVSRLDSPDALPTRVMWRDSWDFYPEARHEYLPYTVGVEEKRKFVWHDFGTDPHILVGGTTGSGKSNQVNGMIATWLKTHSPDELRIVLIDQKGGLEFGHWSEVPHLLWNVGKVVDDVVPILTKVVALMRKRMEILEAVHVKKLEAYNKIADKKMARVVVIIDEMANMAELGPITDEIHNLIMIITAMGRAVGVHLICATQQPEVKIVPGRLKVNMRMRISGSMPSTSASMTILDIPDAVSLKPIPGRIMVVSGMQKLMVQAPLIEDDDIAHIVSYCMKKHPNVAEELWEVDDVPKLPVWNEDRVTRASLDWNNGTLSGSTLHKLLGDESPGERFLRTLCKRVIERGKANGGVLEFEGVVYRLKGEKGGATRLIKMDVPGKPGVLDVVAPNPISVPNAPESVEESQPLDDEAA